jgi:hypothetical protein
MISDNNNTYNQIQMQQNTAVVNTVGNAKAVQNMHNGQPRTGVQFDNKLGQYDNNPQWREVNPSVVREQQRARQQDTQKAEQAFEDKNFIGQAGQPYRVYLRPDQIDQVSNEFRVRSVNRGQVTYVIPGAASSTTTRGGGQKTPEIGKGGFGGAGGRAPTAVAPKPGANPAAPITQPAQVAAPAPAKGQKVAEETLVDGQNQKNWQGGQQQQAMEKVGMDRAAGEQRLEVIITIQPPAAVTQLPAASQSKGDHDARMNKTNLKEEDASKSMGK